MLKAVGIILIILLVGFILNTIKYGNYDYQIQRLNQKEWTDKIVKEMLRGW